METAKGKTREEAISKLADRIDAFEKYSHPHSHLMTDLAALVSRRLGLAETDAHAITEAALLHDIGLYAMAPQYHSSPNNLSFEERMDLWRHPIIGEQQLAKREATRHAQLLVRWHHEWWNGSGYPDMLAFEDIPIGARILRAVELFSALVSDRPYRTRMSDEQALETLKASAGVECDPYVIKALVALIEELLAPAPDEVSETQEIGDKPSAFSPNDALDFGRVEPPGTAESNITGALPFSKKGETVEPGAGAYELSQSSPAVSQSKVATSCWPEIPAESDEQTSNSDQVESAAQPSAPFSSETTVQESAPSVSSIELLISRAKDFEASSSREWRAWQSSRYNRKSLLGFEASVLRQLEFRTVAMPFCGERRIDWYLRAWGKHISANDPRAWAAMMARAAAQAKEPLGEEEIARLIEDIYVPRTRLTNPALRRWFGETDAWWMDNLRRNVESLEDETQRAQAIMLGLQTGDYALSFNEETLDLRQPLTTVFWRLAGRACVGHAGHPNNRSSHLPAEEFIKRVRVDLLYLSLPSAHAESAGAEARSEWRECWVRGAQVSDDNSLDIARAPQSKQSYLAMIDRLLGAGPHIRVWAIEYQEIGLATASEIAEVIKEHRPVKATYSKDVTEAAGGLRNYIIMAEKAS